MTARPVFTVSGAKATGDVPTVQANGSVAWATPSGGSQPDLAAVLAEGGDPAGHAITGAVLIDTHDVAQAALTIKAEADAQSELFNVHSDAAPLLGLDSFGNLSVYGQDGGSSTLDLGTPVGAAEYVKALTTRKPNGSDYGVIVYANGQLAIQGNAAISDDNMVPGGVVIWFDSALGVVHFKGMLDNLSIKTASVALS